MFVERNWSLWTPRFALFALWIVLGFATNAAQAQQRDTRVTRANSVLILDVPELERGQEVFHYLGWNTQFSAETSVAAVTSTSGPDPHAIVIMQQLSKGWLWRAARLDEAWIKSRDVTLRNKRIQITQPASDGSNSYLNYVLFSADDAPCVGFDFRRYAPGVVDAGVDGEAGFSGVYCARKGATLGDAEVKRVVAGVYVRNKNEIRRAYELDVAPIPDRVRR